MFTSKLKFKLKVYLCCTQVVYIKQKKILEQTIFKK